MTITANRPIQTTDDSKRSAIADPRTRKAGDTGSSSSVNGSTSIRARRGNPSGRMTRSEVADLIDKYRRSGDISLRNKVLENHMSVADGIVRRFVSSSNGQTSGIISNDDLRQVARMALIGAIERFDPFAGASLTTFATRTIEGELKRFMRDRSWLVRPPRRLQESHLNIKRAAEDLQHELRRQPTVSDLAERLDMTERDVREGLVASQVRSSESLDRQIHLGEDPAPSTLADELGDVDSNFDRFDDMQSLSGALRTLDEKQLKMVRMRYGAEMSQSAIAAAFGMSQSYVSRTLTQAVNQLRYNFFAAA